MCKSYAQQGPNTGSTTPYVLVALIRAVSVRSPIFQVYSAMAHQSRPRSYKHGEQMEYEVACEWSTIYQMADSLAILNAVMNITSIRDWHECTLLDYDNAKCLLPKCSKQYILLRSPKTICMQRPQTTYYIELTRGI